MTRFATTTGIINVLWVHTIVIVFVSVQVADMNGGLVYWKCIDRCILVVPLVVQLMA